MPYLLFIVAIVCSVFSQHPVFIGTPIASFLKYFWGVPFVYMMIRYAFHDKMHKNHKIVNRYLIFTLIFFLYDFVFVPKTDALIDRDVINVFISLLVFLTSYFFWKNNADDKFMNLLCALLVLTLSFVGYFVYINFLSVQDIDALEYAYASKNSIAQIILAAIIVSFFNFQPDSKTLKIVNYIFLFFLTVLLFLLKCRSALLGLFVVVGYLTVINKEKSTRKYARIILFIVLTYFVFRPEHLKVIVDNIFLAGRDVHDIDDVSSGRAEMISRAWPHFWERPFLGYGYCYVDCFPIAILIQYGILGFVTIISSTISIFKGIFKENVVSSVNITTKLLAIVFLINSMFEAQAPYGPGIKCFILWMLVGFMCAESDLINIIKK